MNTQHKVREFALVTALAMGALIASASQAGEIANLGSLTVSAPRISDTRVADLGSMTVSARREASARVADLGAMTVTARRIGSVALVTQPSDHSWN